MYEETLSVAPHGRKATTSVPMFYQVNRSSCAARLVPPSSPARYCSFVRSTLQGRSALAAFRASRPQVLHSVCLHTLRCCLTAAPLSALALLFPRCRGPFSPSASSRCPFWCGPAGHRQFPSALPVVLTALFLAGCRWHPQAARKGSAYSSIL